HRHVRLFRPGAFDFQDPNPTVMIGFWAVFDAFFFGLTYGLLRICTERTLLRREHLVGLRLGSYVASKAPFSFRSYWPSSCACSVCSASWTAYPAARRRPTPTRLQAIDGGTPETLLRARPEVNDR